MERADTSEVTNLIYGLPERFAQLWEELRLPLLWSVLAIFSLGVLVAFSVTQRGSMRLAQLPYEIADVLKKESPGTSFTAMLDKNLTQFRQENARLVDSRAKLESRVAELERSFGDITGSVPKKQPTGEQTSATAAPTIKQSAPSAQETLPPAGDQTQSISPPPAKAIADNMLGVGNVTLATRSQFGIDLGSDVSISAMKQRWVKLMDKYGALMNTFDPVIAVREAAGGTIQLHLVAGPFSDITEAAALCAKLRADGFNGCIPATYDGQRLAYR